MRKSLQTNKKLDQLEDTQPHQMNYPLGQKDHNVIDNPQCINEIILLTDFVTLPLIFCEDTKTRGEWCTVCVYVCSVLLYL